MHEIALSKCSQILKILGRKWILTDNFFSDFSEYSHEKKDRVRGRQELQTRVLATTKIHENMVSLFF